MVWDPGSGGQLAPDRDRAVFPVTTLAAESRTLVQPTKAGLITTVVLDVDGGDLTLTVTGGYNADAETSITFDDAGDFVTFISIKVGTSYVWRVVAQEGTTTALEDFSVDALTLTTLTLTGTTVTATGTELNVVDSGPVFNDLAVTAGVGITGAADNFASGVEQVGTLFKTTIVIDIDGLNCGDTVNDIIGDDTGGAAHLGQITTARNGTIFAGTLRCIEAPVAGDIDIDLYAATEPTGIEDSLVTDLTETILCNSGNLSAGSEIPLTAFPATTKYLYLASGADVADATYTAGILVIELWGK